MGGRVSSKDFFCAHIQKQNNTNTHKNKASGTVFNQWNYCISIMRMCIVIKEPPRKCANMTTLKVNIGQSSYMNDIAT